jgi:hypothetical protein
VRTGETKVYNMYKFENLFHECRHPSNPLDVNGNDLASLANTNFVMGLLLCTKEAMVSMKNYNINGYIINVNSHFDHKVPIILDTPPYNNSNGLTGVREEITALKTEKIRMTVGENSNISNLK